MDDFQKEVPEGERLDPYSAEFWDEYVRPGDMIIYHNKGTDPAKVSSHIAIAGHDNRQLYHDGSTTYNVRDNSDRRPHGNYKDKKNYGHFTIIWYENTTNLKVLEAIKNQDDDDDPDPDNPEPMSAYAQIDKRKVS